MKKRIVLFLLLMACLIGFAACGENGSSTDSTTASNSENTSLSVSTPVSVRVDTPPTSGSATATMPMTPEEEAAAIQRVVDKLKIGFEDAEIVFYHCSVTDDPHLVENLWPDYNGLYYFARLPDRNVLGIVEGHMKLWAYYLPTDTLIDLRWDKVIESDDPYVANGAIIACKMPDPYNLYALVTKFIDDHGTRCFPVLAHFRLTPRLVGDEFTCEIACETEPYYAPVSEDLYVAGFGVNIGGMEVFAREQLIGIGKAFDGISLLVDLPPEYRMLSRDESAPWLNADFCYDGDARTLTLTMECTPADGIAFGDLGIQNVYIESAELREYKTHGAQLVLRLTEYARYYTVVEDRVFAPDRPPSGIMQSGESVYAQCYYRNLKILFSVGEYEKSDERMTHAEGYPYHVYADPMTWQSAWESIKAAWTPMDLREALVPYVRAVQESGYMPSQTLDDWPKRPSAQF